MIEKSYKVNQRFSKPDEGFKYPSPYDRNSQELLDLDQRREPGFRSLLGINLAAAPIDPQTGLVLPVGSMLEILMPGRAVSIFIYSTADATKAPVSGLVNMTTQRRDGDLFPMRSGRAFYGDFTRLYFSWALQAGNSMDIIIYQFDAQPSPCV